jgi:hypothetical protein
MDKQAIESLRTFAMQHNEIEFAHMCTTALEGDKRAVELIDNAIHKIDMAQSATGVATEAYKLRVIRATDTTRPDGAIARKFEI